jgi:hypothetical protein
VRRRLAVLVAAVSAIAAVVYTRTERVDDGYIVWTMNGVIDPVGEAKLAYTRATRDCRDVQKTAQTEALAALAASNLASRTNGATPKPRAGWKQAGWILVETDFDNLEPAVVLLEPTAEGKRLASLYGGTAAPFNDVQAIHQSFAQQRNDVPRQLINCYEPIGAPFDRAS